MGMSTTPNEKAFLRHQIFRLNAQRVLEIGSFKGETTRVLSEAVASTEGTVVAIDPMQWASEVIRNGILRHVAAGDGGVIKRVLERIEPWLPLSSYERAFWREVKAGGHENVRLFRQLSTDPVLLANGDSLLAEFDVVFIDGDHSFDGASADLNNWGRRVRAGGLVLVHDATDQFPGVCKAIEKWAVRPGVRV